MLNFKSFRSAKNVLVGIELMHMIRKGQLLLEGGIGLFLPTSSLHWQEKSVSFEELASAPAPNTFVNRLRDRTT